MISRALFKSASIFSSQARVALRLPPHACPWSAVRDSDAAGPHLWLIDLVGIRLHADLRRKRCVQNLARLHASFRDHPLLTLTDRLRFLRTEQIVGTFSESPR